MMYLYVTGMYCMCWVFNEKLIKALKRWSIDKNNTFHCHKTNTRNKTNYADKYEKERKNEKLTKTNTKLYTK